MDWLVSGFQFHFLWSKIYPPKTFYSEFAGSHFVSVHSLWEFLLLHTVQRHTRRLTRNSSSPKSVFASLVGLCRVLLHKHWCRTKDNNTIFNKISFQPWIVQSDTFFKLGWWKNIIESETVVALLKNSSCLKSLFRAIRQSEVNFRATDHILGQWIVQ